MKHEWVSKPSRERGKRLAVCANCKVRREDTSCMGRRVDYWVNGKWTTRVPKCRKDES